jgi:hypothetical protein
MATSQLLLSGTERESFFVAQARYRSNARPRSLLMALVVFAMTLVVSLLLAKAGNAFQQTNVWSCNDSRMSTSGDAAAHVREPADQQQPEAEHTERRVRTPPWVAFRV